MRVELAIIAALALGVAGCGRGEAGSEKAARDAAFFMTSNARGEGVTTLPSGVQYKVLKSGPADGPRPDSNDLVSVLYEGALTNGEVFDRAFERGQPYVTPLDQVVPGWTEALQLMKPGDEWLIYIPPELGYGPEGRPPTIPGNSVLVFRVVLLGVAEEPGGGRGPVGRG